MFTFNDYQLALYPRVEALFACFEGEGYIDVQELIEKPGSKDEYDDAVRLRLELQRLVEDRGVPKIEVNGCALYILAFKKTTLTFRHIFPHSA